MAPGVEDEGAYLDVLHHVSQLHQELFGLGGSVRQASESLRQLALWREQREEGVRDGAMWPARPLTERKKRAELDCLEAFFRQSSGVK
ncbi:hypothetical protein EYF80_011437 [Liparis tanakae]|uniref:Uncharacterized protein n=1 Tax=Liparis tanakae TaxID=230148 RepID=A0A4Z2IK81_9TELE|nr:hypothetical protein EYF80_011437 [Liparis tanakae]